MSVELTNIHPRVEDGKGQVNDAYINDSTNNLAEQPTVYVVETTEIVEDNFNCCQRGMNNIQSGIYSTYKENKKLIWRIIYVVLAILYFAYFGYAMYYRFGDEGSIRLLVVALLGVLFIVYILTWDFISEPFTQCGDKISSDSFAKGRTIIRWALYFVASIIIIIILVFEVAIPAPSNLISLAGLCAFILVCYCTSTNPGKVNWHPVFWGLALQFFFAAIILKTQWGYDAFEWLGDRVTEFLAHTNAGSEFVFGDISIHFFAFTLMPVVTFFSAIISVTYYLGIMQAIVRVIGRFLAVCLGTTPAESLNAAGNIFVGMTEAPLMIGPFLESMTISELHAVMTGGFATIAGSVLGAYIGFGVPANHLLSASVMSAPAALAISKLMCPETQISQASSADYGKMKKGQERNVIEAASAGASMSIRLIANIVVNLIAFLAILDFVNATLIWVGERVGIHGLTFEFACSYLLYPVALFMGTNPTDCRRVAELVGVKTFTNEFIAYKRLQALLLNRQTFLNYTETYNNTEWYWDGQDAVLTNWNITLAKGFMEERSEVISTYALCGFSNIGSIGILLGGLSALAPSRKSDLASIVVRAMIAGNIACFFTACIAGLFFTEFGTL